MIHEGSDDHRHCLKVENYVVHPDMYNICDICNGPVRLLDPATTEFNLRGAERYSN